MLITISLSRAAAELLAQLKKGPQNISPETAQDAPHQELIKKGLADYSPSCHRFYLLKDSELVEVG